MTPQFPIRNANTVGAGLTGTQISRQRRSHAVLLFGCPQDNIATRLRPIGPARVGTMQGVSVTATSAIASNPTSFEAGNATFDNVEITVAHIVKRGHVTNPEAGNGLDLNGHSELSYVRDFDREVWALAMLAVSAASFGAADLTSAAADFDISDLETLAKTNAGNPRTALVASGALPGVSNDLKRDGGKWVYPGLDAGVCEAALTGSSADVAIVAGPTALAYMVEKPVELTVPPGEVVTTEIVLPVTRLTVWKYSWVDRSTRAKWVSIEALFGIAPAELTALTYCATS